ncbi:MAG: GAF domain-containing protein [Leptolyngbyaceae cyanobacterium SL_7_1]|nr:GAF domain-containing protein [Leptolyngbyaceae cyanobacterium SL_7_1]
MTQSPKDVAGAWAAGEAAPGQLNSLAVLLHRMTNRIRRSLELSEILTATVTEVQAFLQTDRVKVYRFHEDGSGEVVAEVIQAGRLPSLLGHNFPAEDIPASARELFLTARQRSIVDITAQQIGVSSLESDRPDAEATLGSDIRFRDVDPCHVEYLTAMGVRSSLVVPILEGESLWGLLVSHHSMPRPISEQELEMVQLISDQVSIAIAQSTLLNQTRQRAAQEATINQIATLLNATPETQLQEAIEKTVQALQGCGGRIYIALPSYQSPQLVTYGAQPVITPADPHPALIEQHPQWRSWLAMEPPIGEDTIWAIADLYSATLPSDLALAFLSIQARSLLIVHLHYRQQPLGYLTIFRREIDTERIWAGQINWSDDRQALPRRSFETWRELKQGQAHQWTAADIALVQALSDHFALAIHQGGLYQQVWTLNADLKRDIQKRKQAEIKISALNAELEQRVLERTNELQQANAELVQQVAERERALLERQQAEASLARLSHQNELILNSAAEGIYGLNSQGQITFANPAAARMLGYEVEELIQQQMHSLLHHAHADGTPYLPEESPIYTTLRDGKVQHRTGDTFCQKDGTHFPVEYVSSPIRECDRIVGAVVLFKDITDRQLVEQMKDEFVSIVSHELRTPLTSIRSTLGLLASGWLNNHPERSQRMLEIASSNTNRLVRLINDILDIERIKFGKVTMEKNLCNAAELMTQSVDVMRAMADKAGIFLAVTTVSVNLWADCDRIIQTLTNLLSNAIKFSPAGSTVWLTAEVLQAPGVPSDPSSEAVPDSSDYILFCVRDQGIGIPGDKLETIFDRFQQVDASTSRSQGGTGLGLTICRGIVQQHGGQIWVESVVGEGSTFCFTLALSEPTSRDSLSHDEANLNY